MAFTGKQAGGRVKSNPAGTGNIHLAPSMEVSKVFNGASWAVKGFNVGFELHQITRGKACGQPQGPEYLYQKPSAITAGAFLQRQGLLTTLHAGFHADTVFDLLLQLLVEADQKIIDWLGFFIQLTHPFFQ